MFFGLVYNRLIICVCACISFCLYEQMYESWGEVVQSIDYLGSITGRAVCLVSNFCTRRCVFIQHGVSGGRRLRLPWCTSSLCSAVWEQRAALFASLVAFGWLPRRQRSRSLLSPLSQTSPALLFSLSNTHRAPLSTSFAPHSLSSVVFFYPRFLTLAKVSTGPR